LLTETQLHVIFNIINSNHWLCYKYHSSQWTCD